LAPELVRILFRVEKNSLLPQELEPLSLQSIAGCCIDYKCVVLPL
jgi:hypothetical protein